MASYLVLVRSFGDHQSIADYASYFEVLVPQRLGKAISFGVAAGRVYGFLDGVGVAFVIFKFLILTVFVQRPVV